jgi:cytochrome c oxidase subunit 3
MSTATHASLAPPRGVPATLGMWVFIGSELLFFGGLLAAYGVARLHWPHGFGTASRHTDVVLGTLNTAVLLTSSAVIAFAAACGEQPQQRHRVARLLWFTAALGCVFMGIKGWEYVKDFREHLWPGPGFAVQEPGAELFFMLYFFMTALHALHLLCGIVTVGIFARGSARRRPWASPTRIEAVALYWHFVDIVWIFLYPFLYLVERHA